MITDTQAMDRLAEEWMKHIEDDGWSGAAAVDFIALLLIETGRPTAPGEHADLNREGSPAPIYTTDRTGAQGLGEWMEEFLRVRVALPQPMESLEEWMISDLIVAVTNPFSRDHAWRWFDRDQASKCLPIWMAVLPHARDEGRDHILSVIALCAWLNEDVDLAVDAVAALSPLGTTLGRVMAGIIEEQADPDRVLNVLRTLAVASEEGACP
jgi:hypothetical protein